MTDDELLAVAATVCEMPSNAVPVSAVVFMSWLNPDGTSDTEWRVGGENTYGQLIGGLHMVAFDLAHQARDEGNSE